MDITKRQALILKLLLLGLFLIMMLSAPSLARSEIIGIVYGNLSIYNLIFHSIEFAPNNQNKWYESVLVSSLLSFALGVVLTYVGNYMFSGLQERKELDRYEYYILSVTLDLINRMNEERDESTRKDLKDLLNKVHSELRFFKLGTYQLVIAALSKGYNNEDISQEAGKIRDRLERLKNSRPR